MLVEIVGGVVASLILALNLLVLREINRARIDMAILKERSGRYVTTDLLAASLKEDRHYVLTRMQEVMAQLEARFDEQVEDHETRIRTLEKPE